MMAVLNELNLLSNDENSKLLKYQNTILKNHRKLNVGSIEVEIL
jgi:hypothetical protein